MVFFSISGPGAARSASLLGLLLLAIPAGAAPPVTAPMAAPLWQVAVDGSSAPGPNRAEALRVDTAGDVIAAGAHLVPDPTAPARFAVFKFAGGDGAELWRTALPGLAPASALARALALDAAGNVIAAGSLEGPGPSRALAVAKLSGATGTLIWLAALDGEASPSFDFAEAVAVDASGDVFVAGALDNAGGRDFAVVKLSGATGQRLWGVAIDGAAAAADVARSLAVDASGDVFAAGALQHAAGGLGLFDFTVLKLAGASGAELWRAVLPGRTSPTGFAQALALDAAGDAVAAGALFRDPAQRGHSFAVAKLSGGSGALLWLYELRPGASGRRDVAEAVAIDAAGDVVAGGYTDEGGAARAAVVAKLRGSDGARRWLAELSGTDASGSNAVMRLALGAAGNIFAAGWLQNAVRERDLSLLALSGASGELLWQAHLDGAGGVEAGAADYAAATALGADGNVLVAGALDRGPAQSELALAKFSSQECDDGLDNDGDGLTDFPDDPGCDAGDGASEGNDCGGGDADLDGICDAVDNCLGLFNPEQSDTGLDGYGNRCDFDYDDNGVVGGPDYTAFGRAFGAQVGHPGYRPELDADSNGGVGGLEFFGIRNAFGKPPGPSGLACAGSIPCAAP